MAGKAVFCQAGRCRHSYIRQTLPTAMGKMPCVLKGQTRVRCGRCGGHLRDVSILNNHILPQWLLALWSVYSYSTKTG